MFWLRCWHCDVPAFSIRLISFLVHLRTIIRLPFERLDRENVRKMVSLKLLNAAKVAKSGLSSRNSRWRLILGPKCW